jgi:hypothetical protein
MYHSMEQNMTVVSSTFSVWTEVPRFQAMETVNWLTQHYNGVSAATANIHHIHFLFQWPDNRQWDI